MLSPEQKEIRKLRTALKALCNAVTQAVEGLDRVGKQPPGFNRGKAMAATANYLEMAKDSARHFALGESLKPRKRVASNG